MALAMRIVNEYDEIRINRIFFIQRNIKQINDQKCDERRIAQSEYVQMKMNE